jgi:hypothetical protein
MTWPFADTSLSSYNYQLTKYGIWQFTQYSKVSYKIREGLHATILRSMRGVKRLAGNHCISWYLIETVYRVR